jgi:YYY domain-containing protein
MLRDILAWAFTTEVLGLAVLPLLRRYFDDRRDAALLSRPLGLAIVAYVGWVLSYVLPTHFSRITLLAAFALVALASWRVRRGSAEGSPAREAWWGDEERLAAILFWASTGVFLIIRAVGPAVYGAEKYMDLAFLNSLARFPGMPPADPWMSGKSINYYYWGYLLAAVQAKLSGLPPLLPSVRPTVAYNLSVASFPGFAFVSAACLGFRLSRGRLGVGLAAAGGTVFAGNVVGALDAWASPFARDFDYWHASRVIAAGNTINEFPFFTFFHADLHPHLLAFPYFVAAFAVAHRFIERGTGLGEPSRGWVTVAARLGRPLLLALVAGTAWAASLWNAPAMVILLIASGIFVTVHGRRLPSLGEAVPGALYGGLVAVVAYLLFYGYYASFHLADQGLGHADLHSGWIELLGVWGTWFVALALALWPSPREDTEGDRRRRDFFLALTGAGVMLVAFALGATALAIMLFLGALAARAAWRALRSTPEGDPSGLFAAFLVLLGLGMIGGCELIYFRDSYGHDLERMNTIFKFYHQAWPLLAIGGAVFAGRAWEAGGRRRTGFRAVIAAVVIVSVMYPLNATISRIRQKDGPLSFDALEPFAKRSPGDAETIAWMLRAVPAGAVVMEATGDPYSDFGRIATHTGIPSVLGWANHEGLWRNNDREVAERIARVRNFYTAGDPRQAWETVSKFGVTHVVVGDLERRTYPRSDDVVGSYPFLEPLHLGPTTVYKVNRPK